MFPDNPDDPEATGTRNLAESIGHNALLIPGILFLVYAIFRRPGSRWAIAWGAVFVVFTVLRNLPGSPLAA